MKKNCKIEFKLSEEMLINYKKHCEDNGYDMSKRLRMFIENELPTEYKTIKLSGIEYEPYIKLKSFKVDEYEFSGFEKGPNVFIFSTEDILNEGDNITFRINLLEYKLDGIKIFNQKDNRYIIECSNWKIKYLNI